MSPKELLAAYDEAHKAEVIEALRYDTGGGETPIAIKARELREKLLKRIRL